MFTWILLAVGILAAVSTAIVLACCMLSGRISRQIEHKYGYFPDDPKRGEKGGKQEE